MANKKVSEMSPEELEIQRKYFREWTRNKKLKMTEGELIEAREKKCEYDKQYREENKIKIKKDKKEYYEENKEVIVEKKKVWVQENREKVRETRKKNYWKDQEGNIKKTKEYGEKNKEKISEHRKQRSKEVKICALNVLGGCKCEVCGESILDNLTIDHIDNTGRVDKKEGYYGGAMYMAIFKGTYPKDRLSNLRVLCYNHNCARRREYLDLPPERLNSQQKKAVGFWKEAFNFFGSCEICGETDLKFLTIDHKNGNGTKERLNGGKFGVGLIKEFQKQGWPESLKESYRFLCYNHNCSLEGRKKRFCLNY
jgi:hypothetical protein